MSAAEQPASKVPEVTLIFWIMKIAATTLGETGGDTVTMTLSLGYLVGTLIFFSLLVILVVLQIAAKKFHPVLYWATIVASTTAGTVLADFLADRSLGVGYAGGSAILLVCLMIVLATWYWSLGFDFWWRRSRRRERKASLLTAVFSRSLGTAVGDWIADDTGLGYVGGALLAAALAVLVGVYYWTKTPAGCFCSGRYLLRWPLGAMVGDFLDKPVRRRRDRALAARWRRR